MHEQVCKYYNDVTLLLRNKLTKTKWGARKENLRSSESFAVSKPCSKIVANLLFFYMYVNKPSLPYFRLKILLYFAHADEAKRATLHGYKRIIKWPPFCNKVYN